MNRNTYRIVTRVSRYVSHRDFRYHAIPSADQSDELCFQEWRALGLPMSTSSDEACKLYDAALTQASTILLVYY